VTAGRPTKYNATFHPKLVEAYARLGMTDVQIAEELEISEKTLNNWKEKYPEFLQSMSRGKNQIDDQVESALLKKALGYEYDDEKPFQFQGGPVKVTYKKIVDPDYNSIRLWLLNRRPKKWRDKVHIEDDTDFSRQKDKLDKIRESALKENGKK